MAKLDINGYNATFRTFVEFAEKTQRDGYDSACTAFSARWFPFYEEKAE